MLDRHITLAHGNGGHFMRELIEEVFARHLGNAGSISMPMPRRCRGRAPTVNS